LIDFLAWTVVIFLFSFFVELGSTLAHMDWALAAQFAPQRSDAEPDSICTEISELRGSRLSGKSSYFWHRGNPRLTYQGFVAGR
jgi:hypothetical protein